MSIEPIGFITILLGFALVYHGARFAITALCLSTLLGAAAAFQLPALGGSSIQPSHLILAFVALGVILRPREKQAMIESLAYPGPGFWFAAYVLFSVVSAFFLPRIFAGATLVYSSARNSAGLTSVMASPLAPGSSNLTQSVYLLGDLVCFAIVSGLARLGYGRFIANQLILTALVCLGFALVDMGTFSIGQPELLDFIRNANYTMHTAEVIGGFKRIVGSFPEASAYGAVALAFFSFTLVLWLERFQNRLTGFATVSVGLTVILCTSTTAYVAGLFMMGVAVLLSFKRLVTGKTTRPYATFLLIMLFMVPCMIMAIALIPSLWNAMSALADVTFASKLQSQSGEERTAWNTLALISFVETSTFGAGLGTVRSSSFVAALLSNVGLTGTVLFLLFLYSLLMATARSKLAGSESRAIGMAGVFACIAQIASATISGSSTDLGLLFSITAGLASGCLTVPYAMPRRMNRPQGSPASLMSAPVFSSR
jgi:hypothetical protein